MEQIARVRNLRGSARKARLVLDLIRGKNIHTARNILTFSNKRFSLKVEKLLNSAIASVSEKEGKAQLDRYFVSKAYADDGPIMRRFMPRAMGRATIIRKRTCHITLAISESPQVSLSKTEEESEKKLPENKAAGKKRVKEA